MNFIVYTFSHLVTFVIHVNVHFDKFIKKKKYLFVIRTFFMEKKSYYIC